MTEGSQPTPLDPDSDAGAAELHARVARLDLAAKVRLLTGDSFWSTFAEPRIGLRRMVLSDGPVGVRGERWDERDPSRNLPSPTAMAATWDPALVERLGRLLATEARRKGVDVLLAPTINLHRSPRGGRHFECFSEDPLLTAAIGSAYVRGVQAGGVAATAKHYVANDSETDRLTVDVRVDERALAEVYLAPFESLVRDAGAWLVMAAYNAVDGVTMTEHPLLDEPLKGEWGFDGVVVSDWFAVRSVEASANAGTDLVMPGPSSPWTDGLLEAVQAGRVDEATLDAKLVRLLRLAARVGALEGFADPPAPEASTPDAEVALLREATAASMVLLRNEGALLPLEAAALRRVAVLGPNGADARTQGGGSATVLPAEVVSPVDGLRAALPDAEVVHVDGVRVADGLEPLPASDLRHPVTDQPGLRVRYLDVDGAVVVEEHRTSTQLVWNGALGYRGTAHVELEATYTPPRTGRYRLGIAGVGRARLAVDDVEVLDATIEPPEGDPAAGLLAPPEAAAPVELVAGQPVRLRARKELPSDGPLFGSITLGVEPARGSDAEELDAAVSAAAAADVAVVVVGTTSAIESEGYDRSSLALPGGQDELVRRVAAANPRTVVVVNSGGPVLLPWRDEVAAVLLAWFPGERFGDALADVLLGVAEPGGRMPTSWPATETDAPVLDTMPVDGVLAYDEGLHVGYRAWLRAGRAPAIAFGAGLGYTTWRYDEVSAPAEVGAGEDVPVTVTVTNTGERRGREVVQVYGAWPDSAVDRPARALLGWAVVAAGPGETVTATVVVRARTFAHRDTVAGRWVVEPGPATLHVGSSAEAATRTVHLDVTS